jgi:hypothetical protein
MSASELQILSNVLVSLAVIIGGGWTIYTFWLQRARESYIRLDLELVESRARDQHADIIIKVRAVNVGKTGVGQQLAWIETFPVAYRTENIDAIRSSQPLRDPRARRFIVFEQHAYLEPGEEFLETLMLQIPTSTPYVLARAIFSGTKPGQTWHTQNVMYVGNSSLS